MSDRKEKRKKRGALPTQMGLMLRTVAGLYLLYLAYSIYNGAGNVEGAEQIAFIAAIGIFVIAGAVVVVASLRALQRGEYEGGASDHRKEMGEEKKEEISEKKRIRFGEEEE